MYLSRENARLSPNVNIHFVYQCYMYICIYVSTIICGFDLVNIIMFAGNACLGLPIRVGYISLRGTFLKTLFEYYME